MNHNFSTGRKVTAAAFAVIAISASTVGSAQAMRVEPVAPSILVPSISVPAAAPLLTAQSVKARAALQDLREQRTTPAC